MIVIGVIVGVAVIAGMWVVASYNRLVALKNQSLNGWKQIDIQLKRRHDLIPNLVETVKGAMKFEQNTLTQVIEARSKAMSAMGVGEKSVQENALSGALRQLFALTESYPNLKSNENVGKLQEELSSTENKIGFARQFYNDITTSFNVALQSFPTNVFAGWFGFRSMELFGLTDDTQRQTPKVDLDLKS